MADPEDVEEPFEGLDFAETLERVKEALREVRISSAEAAEHIKAASASVNTQKALIREASVRGRTRG